MLCRLGFVGGGYARKLAGPAKIPKISSGNVNLVRYQVVLPASCTLYHDHPRVISFSRHSVGLARVTQHARKRGDHSPSSCYALLKFGGGWVVYVPRGAGWGGRWWT